MSSAFKTAAQALGSADLETLLTTLHDNDLRHLAGLLVDPGGSSIASRRVLPQVILRPQLSRQRLIDGIAHDLPYLASHTTDRNPTSRQLLQVVALRHNIEDQGTEACPKIERPLQQKYLDALRPVPEKFKDKGSHEWYRSIAYNIPVGGWVAFLLSPNWKAVTGAVLEIAALRRLALTQELAESLEV